MRDCVCFILSPYLSGAPMARQEALSYAAPWGSGRSLSQKICWERPLMVESFALDPCFPLLSCIFQVGSNFGNSSVIFRPQQILLIC